MPLTLDVDGVRTASPSAGNVADAFESLAKRTGFFDSGISHIVLQKDATHWLAAFGTFTQGFSLSYQEGAPNCVYYAEKQYTPVTEVIGIFQAYADGKDWGRSWLTWEPFPLRDKTMTLIKSLVVIAVLGYLVVWAIVKLTAQ